MLIRDIRAREILDSRGNPTVEADVCLVSGAFGRAAVPSGASTGSNEAHELRDDDARYGGRGVLKAVAHIHSEILQSVVGREFDQRSLDESLMALDGTENKSRLGANTILAISLAFARAAAEEKKQPLYEYIRTLSSDGRELLLPTPMCNIINGGKHAAGSTDVQEFMVMPVGAATFSEALRMCAEIFHSLKKVLASKGYGTTVGDEGGYAPAVKGANEEALALLIEAIEKAGYKPEKDVVLALDVAATELYNGSTYKSAQESLTFSSNDMIAWYQKICAQYPIRSIEDGLSENDWEGWRRLTEKLGSNTQLVGDDLLVTNVAFLKKAIEEKAGNAILIKLNQIGTLTETIEAVDMAHAAGWRTIISHRSGETEDTFISHLAVGLGTGQIKTGSTSRTDRVAKYNELLRIEEQLGEKARFAGNIFK